MATQIEPEADAPSAYCPNCLGRMSPASTFCASCGSQTAIEISVAKLGDSKTAYFAARMLQTFDSQAIASVAELSKSLQTRNFHFRSTMSWTECEALIENLGANQIAATVRYVVIIPTSNSLGALVRRPAVMATAGIVFIAIAGYLTLGGDKPAVQKRAQSSTDTVQLEISGGDSFPARVRKPESQPDEPQTVPADEAAIPAQNRARFSFENVRRSVVTLKTANGQGTGFVVHPGYILTNHHVLDGLTTGGSVDVLFADAEGKLRTIPSRVHRVHKNLDLGLVVCSQECETLPALPLGRSTLLGSGATIFAIGSPLGLSLTLSRGIVSNVARALDGALFLQSDVQVNPGNSGGPALNNRGEVIGVVTAKVSGADGISFILPIEYATQGPDAILDGLPSPAPAYDEEFSLRLAAIDAGDSLRSNNASARAEEAARDKIALMGAYISPANDYAVKFRVKWSPTSAMPPSGPFYIVIQQKSTGYKGTFQLTDLATPIKLAELEDGALIYEFKNQGKFTGVAKFAAGDKVSVRMRDDIFSNVLEMTGQ